MQNEVYLEWLKNWFNIKINWPKEEIYKNFFSEGVLDSFRTLELVLDIENEFKISLGENIVNDSRFASINGLAQILAEQVNNT